MKLGGGGEPCTLCAKTVYPAERQKTSNGVYHVKCFSCTKCKRQLQQSTYVEDAATGRLYCKPHYAQLAKEAGLDQLAKGGVDESAGVLVVKKTKQEIGAPSPATVSAEAGRLIDVVCACTDRAACAHRGGDRHPRRRLQGLGRARPSDGEPRRGRRAVRACGGHARWRRVDRREERVRRHGGRRAPARAARRARFGQGQQPAGGAAKESARPLAGCRTRSEARPNTQTGGRMSRHPPSPPPLCALPDRRQLLHLNEPNLLDNVRQRFNGRQIYTYTGQLEVRPLSPFTFASVCVARPRARPCPRHPLQLLVLNPYEDIDGLYGEARMAAHRDALASADAQVEPHT
eukprot:2450204-Prymnesium_polylepis.1